MSESLKSHAVELTPLKVSVLQYLTFEFIDELRADAQLRDAFMKDTVALRFNTRVWAEDVQGETVDIKYPADWWQALPVIYRTHHIELKGIYPKLKMARHESPCILHAIEGGQTIAAYNPEDE